MVAQRTREIEFDCPGSSVRQAMAHMGGAGLHASGAGLVVGWLWRGGPRAMRSVLYGVGPYDVTTIVVVVGMLAAIALIATLLPTLRIARIDPARTLREE
jgi:ABC-type antimicrobial peptide transport system permease subunit